MSHSTASPSLKNRFSLNEWTGATGDLGTLLPLAFAIVIYNGYSPNTLFLLWGAAYIITGFIFKVPLPVQPLKAITVIAIAQGLSPEMLSTTAFFYGILFILISTTGFIDWMQKWFSKALVTGIQLGIGLVLGRKAIELLLDHGLFLSQSATTTGLPMLVFLIILGVLLLALARKRYIMGVSLAVLSSILLIMMINPTLPENSKQALQLGVTWPNWTLLVNALTLLMIPQLPLTLGNSVFAAAETSRQLWGAQAGGVTPRRLGLSVGISNTLIGLLGGFPMCHGAGGMTAHDQLGARTGGATIIMGSVLVVLSLFSSVGTVLFLIPVPILAAFLLVDAWRMVFLVRRLSKGYDSSTAIIVGVLTFFTGNLMIALIIGLLTESLEKTSVFKKILNTTRGIA